jgi:hypothetical protein
MKKKVGISVVFLIVLVGIVFLAFPPPPPPQEPLLTTAPTEPPTPVPTEPAIRYPVAVPAPPIEPPPTAMEPGAEPAPPAPALDPANRVPQQLLTLLDGKKTLFELLQLDHFIQRLVVTVDNLPRKDLPRRQLPVKGATGLFLIQGETGQEMISPYNSRRYAPFVELAEALDSDRLADIYVRHYPLFQKAYADLGYPSAYFNDRLVEVIDHLLETPEISEPIRLERPGVLYRFADPELEGRSSGQKILLRIGSENAMKIKVKLRELRADLISRSLGK